MGKITLKTEKINQRIKILSILRGISIAFYILLTIVGFYYAIRSPLNIVIFILGVFLGAAVISNLDNRKTRLILQEKHSIL